MKTLLAALMFAPAISGAQQPRTLPAPDAEFPTPFSSVSGVRELADRRLVLVDRQERSVFLVDLQRGTRQRIGREGGGPGEVALPAHILAFGSDSTAIWDGRHARLFFVDAGRALGHASPLSGRDGHPVSVTGQAPRFADTLGRVYFAGVPAEDDAGDSLPILRLDRRSGRIDTVGAVGRPKGGDQATIGPPGQQMTMNFANPFSPAEAWFVTRDGRVGVVRSPGYRVDWTWPTQVRGPALAYTPLPVTDDEKASWRRTMQRSSNIVVADAGARGAGTSPPAVGAIPEPTQWPRTMPPFLASQVVLTDGRGRVWVPRARAWNDASTTYDVFDASGRVVVRIVMREHRRIVGFGRDAVYTVRPDDDDLLHLGRHPLPP